MFGVLLLPGLYCSDLGPGGIILLSFYRFICADSDIIFLSAFQPGDFSGYLPVTFHIYSLPVPGESAVGRQLNLVPGNAGLRHFCRILFRRKQMSGEPRSYLTETQALQSSYFSD